MEPDDMGTLIVLLDCLDFKLRTLKCYDKITAIVIPLNATFGLIFVTFNDFLFAVCIYFINYSQYTYGNI